MGQTYITLRGEVFDLGSLTDVERAYFDRCYAAYLKGAGWDEMSNLATGAENPVVRASGGRITAGSGCIRCFRPSVTSKTALASAPVISNPTTALTRRSIRWMTIGCPPASLPNARAWR